MDDKGREREMTHGSDGLCLMTTISPASTVLPSTQIPTSGIMEFFLEKNASG